MHVVVLIPATDEQRERLRAAAPGSELVFSSKTDVTSAELAEADVIVGNLPPDRVREAPRLRFLLLDSAGFERYVKPGVLPDAVALCNARGAYGQSVSEHMLAVLLALMKRLPAYRDDQRDHVWRGEGHVATLAGSNVLVMGTGDIGSHFAALVSALGAHPTGARRHAQDPEPPFEAMVKLGEVRSVLGGMDVVASALPSAPETRGLVDAGFLDAMRDGAFFVNVGRGDLVDQTALVQALRSGHLAGAALDVCVPEPLPADDPLWDVPGLLITPHQAGRYNLPATLDRIVDIACDNLARISRGEQPRNLVRPAR